jgi:hypothetical protein
MTCNLNEDGGIVINFSFGDRASPILLKVVRVAKPECDVEYKGFEPILVEPNSASFVDIPLPAGDYRFDAVEPTAPNLIVGCVVTPPSPPSPVDVVVASCEIVVPCKVDDDNDDNDDDSQLPPKPEKGHCVRFLVCHNGHTLLVPWHALKAHILIHGDTLGRCHDKD